METKNNKQGAASFYMIIVSALLFGVIAAGFITLMVSEMGKSSESNLSQTAYDSALVGVEDAKILLQKYLSGNYSNDNEKNAIEGEINDTNKECMNLDGINGIAKAYDGSGYRIQEIDTDDDITVQAYTCLHIDLHPTDYLGTLSAENPTRLIPLQSENNGGTQYVRISWYSSDNLGNGHTQFRNPTGADVDIVFSDEASTPPVIVASVYQASEKFSLNDLIEDGAKSRGTLWLVPSEENSNPINASDPRYNDYNENLWPDFSRDTTTESGITTQLKKEALGRSNTHDSKKERIEKNMTTHQGYPVRCAKDSEASGRDYLCSVVLELPQNDGRSSERGTFLLFLAMPYGQPTTDFKVEMSDNGFDNKGEFNAKEFDNVQIIIDSTGRANDVYSRVESRIEFYDSDFPFPDYALTAGSGDDDDAIWKDFITSSEKNDGCWYSSWIGGSKSAPCS